MVSVGEPAEGSLLAQKHKDLVWSVLARPSRAGVGESEPQLLDGRLDECQRANWG